MAVGIGASSLIARCLGAGEVDKAKAAARLSTMVAAITGLLFGIVTLFCAESLLRLIGTGPQAIAVGVVYFRIVAIPSIFISLMTVFGSILRTAGDTTTPMKVGIWINLIHIGLDYVLIFGLGDWEGWGIAGAAWATMSVRIMGAAVLYLRKGSSTAFTLPLLRLSAPAAAERLMMRLGQVFYMGLIVRIGTDVYAAHLLAGHIAAGLFTEDSIYHRNGDPCTPYRCVRAAVSSDEFSYRRSATRSGRHENPHVQHGDRHMARTRCRHLCTVLPLGYGNCRGVVG